MTERARHAAASQTTQPPLPVPRGIAFRFGQAGRRPTLAAARAVARGPLPGWRVRAVEGLAGWFEAVPPAAGDGRPMRLGEFWARLRRLRAVEGVEAEPLLLIVNPRPASGLEADSFALGVGREQFGLWGWPYEREVEAAIREGRRPSDWHLEQMRVHQAWRLWEAKHPGRAPGDGVLVGHPDTGFTDHGELAGRFAVPGRSFLEDADEQIGALDDLAVVGPIGFLEMPGHGTATASVIASGERDPAAGEPEAFGVAPGARVLPLRVSRSVIHFDFGNVGRAILHAVDAGADVISMSLGGPGYSGFVRECIGRALGEGVIVVSAAGNAVPATVFPAAFPEVIGVAATHAAKAPWRFSGIGRLVDIAAPGEDVWCARAVLEGGAAVFTVNMGTGTSFATAGVAGLAALWLSFHGGRAPIADVYGGRPELVAFAFQYLLARTANSAFDFVREGRHGAGIADAEALLRAALPSAAEVERFKRLIEAQPVSVLTFVSGLFSGGLGVTDGTAVALTAEATLDAAGRVRTDDPLATDAVRRAASERAAEEALLGRLLGEQHEELRDELLARVAADRLLLVATQRWRQGQSLLPLLDRLLGVPDPSDPGAAPALSHALQQALEAQREAERGRLRRLHRGELPPAAARAATVGGPPAPAARRLRAYAFDPSLETKLATEPITQVTIPARWEPLEPGPVGEYLEVVDVDPASGCAYGPVDLDHPHVLAQNGLPPSEGDPQFHQQMVYAVAMNTINHFEMALGRPIFWSPLRPWLEERPEERRHYTRDALELLGAAAQAGRPNPWAAGRDRYVRRLRVYPHALREANAYYSPSKRALLFGYFPAADDDSGTHYPGGLVFTCLSHDIVAHETTHALLDGMHPSFGEPSNEDVWAFHEAFADAVALFQHFTYPEVLRHQIANTRGNLEADNLLGQLAQQFGQATGKRGALRDALGRPTVDGGWERHTPDPRALLERREPHARGSILIAAVFDAFLSLYNARVQDLLRLASGGSGILPAGQIHPDLVKRLADEAALTAEQVLRVCIRALDYVPPVDLTFGEFLRALITADHDLAPAERQNRIAFIDAFRSWGIYPRDVPTLSEASLRWRRPAADDPLSRLTRSDGFAARWQAALGRLAPALEAWQPRAEGDGTARNARGEVFRRILEAQKDLHELIEQGQAVLPEGQPLLPGLDLRPGARFSVGNLRPARRRGSQGEFRTELVVEVTQSHRPWDGLVPLRGGATLVVDLRTGQVRYVIYKRLYAELPRADGTGGRLTSRARRQRAAGHEEPRFALDDTGDHAAWLAATYACEERTATRRRQQTRDEPFALLHRGFE